MPHVNPNSAATYPTQNSSAELPGSADRTERSTNASSTALPLLLEGLSKSQDSHNTQLFIPHTGNAAAEARSSSSAGHVSVGIENTQSVEVEIPPAEQMKAYFREIFSPHICEGNRAEFANLIESRANYLVDNGFTVDQVKGILNKGRNMDVVAEAGAGFVRSIPFALGGVAVDWLDGVTAAAQNPAQVGAIAGGIGGAADVAGCDLLNSATANRKWLDARADQLEPVMARAKEKVQPSLGRAMMEVGGGFQAYTARNAFRMAVAPLVALASKNAALITDNILSEAGGPVAGAAAYTVMHKMNERAHRVGPEYMLGRKDFQEQFQALDEANAATQIRGGVRRAKDFVTKDVPTRTLAAGRSLLTAPNLAKNGILTAGLAGYFQAGASAAQAVASAGASEPVQELVKHAARLPVFAATVAAWTTADVGMGPAATALSRKIQAAGTGQSSRQESAAEASAQVEIDMAALDNDQGGQSAMARSSGDEANGTVSLDMPSTSRNDTTVEMEENRSTDV